MGQSQGKMDKKEKKELKKRKKQEMKGMKKSKKKNMKENARSKEVNALQALESIMESASNDPQNIGNEQREQWTENQQNSYQNATTMFTSFAPKKAGYMADTVINSNTEQMKNADQSYQFYPNEKSGNKSEFLPDGRREFALIHADISEESSINEGEMVEESSPLPPSPFQDRAADALKEDVDLVNHTNSIASPSHTMCSDFSESDRESDSDTRTVSEKHKEEDLERSIPLKEDVFENGANEDGTSLKEYKDDRKDGDNDVDVEVTDLKEPNVDAYVKINGMKNEIKGMKNKNSCIKDESDDTRNGFKNNSNCMTNEFHDTENKGYIMVNERNTCSVSSETQNDILLKKETPPIHHKFRRSQHNTEILKNDYFQQLPDMYKLEIKDELMQQAIPKWYKKNKKTWSESKKLGEKHKNVTYDIDDYKKEKGTRIITDKNESNSDLDVNVKEKKNPLMAHSTPRQLDDKETLCFTTNLSTIGNSKSQKNNTGEIKQRPKKSMAKNRLKPVKEVLNDSYQSYDKIANTENISENNSYVGSGSERLILKKRNNRKDRKVKARQQSPNNDTNFLDRKNEREQEIEQVERRLTQLRDNMQQWDAVDRMRVDLRAWLHDMQEEVDDLEKQPSKLHAEACEVDIGKLQGIREEVQARGPAVEGLLARYRELTQHNPDLQDPVVVAVKEDWEELLGQIENLIEDREHALQAAKDLQARENEMDDDLENYINALEKIESADVATVQKSAMMKTRKPCRSTQTPRGSARNPNRSFLTGDSDGDSDDDNKFLFPPRPPGSRYSSNTSLKRKRGPGGPRSPSRQSRGSRPSSRFDNLKKSGSGAALESDSEESGYGETYYTMHASSFDNVLDNSVFGEPTPNTMRGTPIGLENQIFSDGESTVSYLSTHAFGANPEDLRDAMSQTPGHTSTQTPAEMWKKSKPRGMQTQTGSNTSLHSIGNQTRRSSGARADLLRNILFEVKGLKQQRGLDTSSYNGTDDDTNSVRSDNTIKKETLQHVLHDMRELREADATGTAATQTVHEEGTQTSMKLFPEGDPIRNARLEKFKNLMDDVKDMKGSRPGTPASRSRASTRSETPVNRPRARTPSRMNATMEAPIQNGFHPAYSQNLNMTAPPVMMNPPMQPPPFIAGRRMVTQEDLNGISQRLERLQGYAPPRRPTPPPPPPQPQYVVPVYAVPPPSRRRAPREDAYLSDESEYGDAEPPRRRRINPAIESALEEASRSALQLKRMSKRMRDSLRDDMQYDFL